MRYSSVANFVDKWMPEDLTAIEFGQDFSNAVGEIASSSILIGIHKADQENARLRDRNLNALAFRCFMFGIVVGSVIAWLLLKLG